MNDINIPNAFVADTYIEWTDTYDKFPADLFTVSYFLVSAKKTITFDGSPSDKSFDFAPDASTYIPDKYRYQITATEIGGNLRKFVIASGAVEIQVNYSGVGADGHDTRYPQERLLDQIQLFLESNITDTRQKITHRDMEVWNYDREGLYALRTQLQRELSQIREAVARRSGRQMKQIRFSQR